jgi:hypothetical protein
MCIVELANDVRSILALQPPYAKMSAGDPLKMIHENDIHRGAADRPKNR